jgi:hypothetical protein
MTLRLNFGAAAAVNDSRAVSFFEEILFTR